MDIKYVYVPKRKLFGKQPLFCEAPVQLIDSIDPDVQEQKRYCLRNPVHSSVQHTLPQSEHFVNTYRAVMRDRGINHAEGGWPKDVNIQDEEAVSRYRRRIERDDVYCDAIQRTYPRFVHAIRQNNAIDMYGMYFSNMKPEEPVETSTIVLKSNYKEPQPKLGAKKSNRPVSSISWTIEDDQKIVVAYCNRTYPLIGSINNNTTCYVWTLSNSTEPLFALEPPSGCWEITCSPVSPNIVLGGLEDGRVCIFDIRANQEPVLISATHLAHRYPVTSVLFIQSRLNTEFFSGSTDGKCMWWDIRNLSTTIDEMIMSAPGRIPPTETPHCGNSEPVSTLSFNRSFPTRFLCGTDTGLVLNVNRKGKTLTEIMSHVFYCHNGPVKSVSRHPSILKMFITCGDWRINIWSEEVISSPIVVGTANRYEVNDVKWAPHRMSGYMSVTADGKFHYFDMLRKRIPVISLATSKFPLLKMAIEEKGQLVAVGDTIGTVFLLNLSNNLVSSGERDKPLLVQTYERENHREHILETRVKEIRLRLKEDEIAVAQPVEEFDEKALIYQAEDEYRRSVQDQLHKIPTDIVSKERKEFKTRAR